MEGLLSLNPGGSSRWRIVAQWRVLVARAVRLDVALQAFAAIVEVDGAEGDGQLATELGNVGGEGDWRLSLEAWWVYRYLIMRMRFLRMSFFDNESRRPPNSVC